MKKMTAIVDLQFGSTGKGLFAGYLSQRKNFDTVVSANMPNAGHTFVDTVGRQWINKVLPSGVYSTGLDHVGLGPGAIFHPRQLADEIDEMRQRTNTSPRIIIHECAALVYPDHKAAEQSLNHISSTMQGSAEAMIHKIKRGASDSNIVSQAADYLSGIYTERGEKLSSFIVSSQAWSDIMVASENILVEGSQGYSLGINAGFYPFCTSRDCTTHRLLADCAVPMGNQLTVMGTARVYPIRVGSTPNGYSGDCYRDQKEITWDYLGVEPEYTTVTKRERRVFTFSEVQIREAIYANGVDQVFLNFCNYNPREAVRVAKVINQIGSDYYKYRGFSPWEGELPQFVRYFGFGPQAEDILEFSVYNW